MNTKKISFLLMITIFIFSICTPVSAKPKRRCPIFMGEVLKINKDDNGNTFLLVDGYLKAQQVNKQNVVAVIGPDTKILDCNREDFSADKIEKGDIVFIVLSEAMTFSIPPQSVARKIQVCKSVNETN